MTDRERPAGGDDPFRLERFVEAQRDTHADALSEIQQGHKRSHWMWFIFPQYKGLGLSEMSDHYAVRSLDEASAFLSHPLLGPRLMACANAVLAVTGRSATDIFGSVDAMKLRSSATLFASVAPAGSVFHRIIDRYFDGRPDEATLQRIRADR